MLPPINEQGKYLRTTVVTLAMAERAGPADWKQQLLLVYDSEKCGPDDPPEDAIVTFIAPLDVEIPTQVRGDGWGGF